MIISKTITLSKLLQKLYYLKIQAFEPDENLRINAWYWSASDDKHSLNKETLSMHSGWDKNGTIVQNLIYLYVHTSKGVVMNSPLK